MGIAYTSVLGRHGIDGITHITQFIAKGFQNGGYDFSDWRTNGVGGHDFNGDASVPLVFLVYLVQKFPENPGSTTSVTRSRAYKIPGYGELRRTFYHLTISQQQSGSNPLRNHILIHKEGPGEFYDEIHIVRIEFENTTGKIHSLHAGSVPSDTGTLSVLDSMALSDYNALTKYFGIQD